MYSDRDFKQCRFNPMVSGKILKQYPELSGVMPENLSGDADKVLRYVIAMYDDKSPLIQAEPHVKRRKEAAAVVAGFSLQDDDSFLESLYSCNVEGVIDLIMSYMFRYTQQRLWVKIVVNEQLFEEYSRRLLRPVSATAEGDKEKDELQSYQIKAKLREELDTIGASLDKYYKELFKDDEELIKKPRKTFTPEAMALAGD